MNGVRAPDRFRAGLGQAEETHFPFADQLSHRANCLFDWRVGVDAMLIIKIDNIDIEPAKTSFARFPDVIGFAIDAAKLRLVWIAQNSKLRSDYLLLAMTFNPATE